MNRKSLKEAISTCFFVLIFAGFSHLNSHLISSIDRPLKKYTETDVIAVCGELPEETRSILVSWHPYLTHKQHIANNDDNTDTHISHYSVNKDRKINYKFVLF